jgi:hypothetical protein
MHNDQEFELTAEERTALAALPREMDTGDLLEERVVRAMRDRGSLQVSRSRANNTLSIAWKIAAAVTLFAGGVATGRYAMANDATGNSINAPATRGRDVGVTPRTDTRPVNQRETVVAEREMWL